jgi:hypothetical protein
MKRLSFLFAILLLAIAGGIAAIAADTETSAQAPASSESAAQGTHQCAGSCENCPNVGSCENCPRHTTSSAGTCPMHTSAGEATAGCPRGATSQHGNAACPMHQARMDEPSAQD